MDNVYLKRINDSGINKKKIWLAGKVKIETETFITAGKSFHFRLFDIDKTWMYRKAQQICKYLRWIICRERGRGRNSRRMVQPHSKPGCDSRTLNLTIDTFKLTELWQTTNRIQSKNIISKEGSLLKVFVPVW